MNKIISIPLVLVLFLSCTSLQVTLLTKKSISKDVKVLKNDSSNQTIVFLPMIHIGKEEYYQSARVIIDSLRALNYSFYYESIAIQDSLNPLRLDTLDRKLRKVVGYHLSENLMEEGNKSLPKSFKSKKYIMQDYTIMGLKKTDIWLDLPQDELIDRYEQNYKPIQLLPCDFETDLGEKYNCKDSVKHNEFYLINLLRDYYIIDKIVKSNESKICMLYGKKHWLVMESLLRKNGFELIHGKY